MFSGPVALPKIYNGHDRTFFLVSYERLKDNVAEPQIFTVPTEAMRRGDFSALIVNRNNIANAANTVIFNPFSGTQSGSNVVRSSFGCPTSGALAANSTCNIIPSNLINPVAANLIKYYPLPNIDGRRQRHAEQLLLESTAPSELSRVADAHRSSHQFNQSIFGKYYHSFNPEDRQDWAGVVNDFPITRGFEYRTNDGGNIDYTNTRQLKLRLRYSRQLESLRAGTSTGRTLRSGDARFRTRFTRRNAWLSIPAAHHDQKPRRHAGRSDRRSARPDQTGTKAASVRSTWAQCNRRLTQVVDNHTLKYGYDFRVVRENFSTDAYKGGQFFFDGTFTAPASNSSSTLRNVFGRDLAAFLLGVPTTGSGGNASQIDNSINYSVQSLYHGIFFQDDWRVSRKLTLNLGLRYDIEQGLTERFNRILRGFDLRHAEPDRSASARSLHHCVQCEPGELRRDAGQLPRAWRLHVCRRRQSQCLGSGSQ